MKRLIIALVATIVMLFLSNAMWLYAWNCYDYEDDLKSISVDGGDYGNTNYIGGNGDISNNGEDNGSNLQETAD